MERLTYRGTEQMTEDGLITPSYSDYPIRRIIERLADYEDAEEQGLLLRLPCKVGDTVYWVYDCRMIREVIVYGFRVTSSKILMLDYSQFPFGNIGVDVFLTKKEAEQVLKDMQGV